MTEVQSVQHGAAEHRWLPCLVLPGLKLRSAIEASPLALAPYDDPRVIELSRGIPKFSTFVERFSNPFGSRVRPTVLLIRSDASHRYFDIECMANFRNAISIAVTTFSRSLELCVPGGHRILYGDTFAFYPWTLNASHNFLVCNTPAMDGLEDVEDFQGQPSAAIPSLELFENAIDVPLVSALLMRWQSAYEGESSSWADVALLRSLNMAYHASLIPAGRDFTLYDIGRTVALWVSAFEILIHPGTGGEANRDKVVDLIERAPWKQRGCRTRIHKVRSRNGTHEKQLGSWLYHKLNQCRNDFLHGNPVSGASLELPMKGRYIHNYAAPLYRMALASYLKLEIHDSAPNEENIGVQSADAKRSALFNFTQCYVEDALLSALTDRDENSGN